MIRQPIPKAGANTPNLFAQFVDHPLERYRATYVGADTVRGEPVDVVRLVPRQPDMPFTQAELAIAKSDGWPRRRALVGGSGPHPELGLERRAGCHDAQRRDQRGAGGDVPPRAELDAVIDAGTAFRTSGCPGKFADDVSACDRPYGDSPPSNIASYPFAPNRGDVRRIRRQMRIVETKAPRPEGPPPDPAKRAG